VPADDGADPVPADAAGGEGRAGRQAPTAAGLAVSRRQQQADRQALARDGRPGAG
jgi:hypothetical protein